MLVKKNHSLQHLNTFGIDAKARLFVEINTPEDLQELIASGMLNNDRYLILGGGSNILFTQHFDGLVIKNNLKGIIKVDEDDQYYYIKAGGGEDWHAFVEYSLNQKWYGLENLSLIPGSVGASPIQNIGAYGVELKEVFHSLNFCHLNGEIQCFERSDCQFGYRDSVFKRQMKQKGIIMDVTFRLSRQAAVNISYGALSNYFSNPHEDNITPEAVSEAVVNIRRRKLPDPSVTGNAGSFFKNPVIDEGLLKKLQSSYSDMPYYDLGNDQYKVPAAWLIDQCGWKGKRKGNAGVHNKQALVLVNHGVASGSEIIELANEIRNSVRERFNISIEPEVNVI